VGKFDELAKEKGGFVRLLAAVYFQESRDRRDEDDAFEFTHKSFGEYLTARRLVREVRQVDKGLREYPDFFSEDRALEAWCRLTGPQAMSMDLFRFLRDEVALRGRDEVARWQETLTRLFNRNLRNGPPLEIYKEDQTFRLMERKARNAEEALLAVLNACALAREEAALDVIPVDWPDANSAGEMLHRLRGQRDPNLPVVVLDCLASLDLSGQILTCQELVWADLRGADLGGSDLRASRCLEADVRGAHLADSDLEDADLRYADLSMANLTEANLLGADLRGARLYAAILIASDLSQAQLLAADLSGADLSAALLINADLSSANLNEAELVAADLSGARLFETDLSDADLSDADLSGADLSAARGLTQKQLDEAWGDERTKLPEGLTIRSRPT
jgi:uncharacterized protein YjbI with pentapeptide repeats